MGGFPKAGNCLDLWIQARVSHRPQPSPVPATAQHLNTDHASSIGHKLGNDFKLKQNSIHRREDEVLAEQKTGRARSPKGATSPGRARYPEGAQPSRSERKLGVRRRPRKSEKGATGYASASVPPTPKGNRNVRMSFCCKDLRRTHSREGEEPNGCH